MLEIWKHLTSFIWIVDTIPPGTIIDSATDGHDEIIIMDGNSSSNSILVEFSGTDSGVGVDHFECSIDTSDFVTCPSPLQFDSLSDGTHTLDVISEDNSTNKDPSPALFRWTVDTTPPETSINSALDVNQSSISNGGSPKSTSITFSFSGTDIGGVDIDHFECSIDNSDILTCITPVQFSNLEDCPGGEQRQICAVGPREEVREGIGRNRLSQREGGRAATPGRLAARLVLDQFMDTPERERHHARHARPDDRARCHKSERTVRQHDQRDCQRLRQERQTQRGSEAEAVGGKSGQDRPGDGAEPEETQ